MFGQPLFDEDGSISAQLRQRASSVVTEKQHRIRPIELVVGHGLQQPRPHRDVVDDFLEARCAGPFGCPPSRQAVGRSYGRVVDRYDPLDRLVYGAMDDDEMDAILDALERASAEDKTPKR